MKIQVLPASQNVPSLGGRAHRYTAPYAHPHPRHPWSPRLRPRPRLHGHVRSLRPVRRGRKHRHHPCCSRRRHQPARHGRLLRHGPQRDADPRGPPGPITRAGGDQRQVRGHARRGRRLDRHRHAARAVKNFLAYTLRRLGTDHVDIYRPARVDPAVPIEETRPWPATATTSTPWLSSTASAAEVPLRPGEHGLSFYVRSKSRICRPPALQLDSQPHLVSGRAKPGTCWPASDIQPKRFRQSPF